jgi:hypothetical protein
MKALLLTALFIPSVAMAQDYGDLYGNDIDEYAPRNGQLNVGVQPVLPVPNNGGPWNTGYSVVTTEREVIDPFARAQGRTGATKRETIQKVVPNDALGNPIKGFDW